MATKRSAASIHITKREMEVLTLVTKGYEVKEVANILFIAPGSVQDHLVRLHKKFNVHRRIHLYRAAIEKGILPLPK